MLRLAVTAEECFAIEQALGADAKEKEIVNALSGGKATELLFKHLLVVDNAFVNLTNRPHAIPGIGANDCDPTAALVNGHTNVSSISRAVDLLAQHGVRQGGLQ